MMITPTQCLDLVYTLMDARPLYKHSFPDNTDQDSFTVINSLGVPADPIQTVEVNVNCYAKDADKTRGIPDLTTLNTMVASALSDLQGYHYNGIYIGLTMSNIFREEGINMHYMNLRFQVKYLSN